MESAGNLAVTLLLPLQAWQARCFHQLHFEKHFQYARSKQKECTLQRLRYEILEAISQFLTACKYYINLEPSDMSVGEALHEKAGGRRGVLFYTARFSDSPCTRSVKKLACRFRSCRWQAKRIEQQQKASVDHLLGAVNAVPEICSAYKPYGHTWRVIHQLHAKSIYNVGARPIFLLGSIGCKRTT